MTFSRIAKLFPPPRFMTLPSVGIDISESSLKYVQLHTQGSVKTLAHWGDIFIPPGVIARGSIVDTAGLATILKQVRTICGTSYVRVSLPEERAYLFETIIERDTPEKDIRNLLEFRMEENVPLSPRDAFFDYEIVADDRNDQKLRIGVAVYAKETILTYYDVCSKAKLVPLSFEVEADAIGRAAISPDENGVFMIIDLGKMRTGLGIVYKHALLYTSTIDIGGQHFSDAIRGKFADKDESALVTLKNERGLLQSGDKGDTYEVLLPVVAALKDEITTRITYWNTRTIESGERSIEKIILCGGSVNMAGLPEYLTEALGIETERVDVWRNVFPHHSIVPPITRRYSYGYTTAIGLALRDNLEQETV
jgi:type IV pilus assembly protein PilM